MPHGDHPLEIAIAGRCQGLSLRGSTGVVCGFRVFTGCDVKHRVRLTGQHRCRTVPSGVQRLQQTRRQELPMAEGARTGPLRHGTGIVETLLVPISLSAGRPTDV